MELRLAAIDVFCFRSEMRGKLIRLTDQLLTGVIFEYDRQRRERLRRSVLAAVVVRIDCRTRRLGHGWRCRNDCRLRIGRFCHAHGMRRIEARSDRG